MKNTMILNLATGVLMTGLVLMPLLPASLRAGGTDAPGVLTASDVNIGIDGQSTLHGWHVSAGMATVAARIRPGGTGLIDELSQGGLTGLNMALGVNSLKSTEGSGMDGNMHKDLGADKFPTIAFSLKSYTLEGTTVTARGDLSIHGQVRTVTLTAQLAPKEGGLVVSGSYPLLMSAYGVKPPVMMFGTVKVADQVAIVYSFKLPD